MPRTPTPNRTGTITRPEVIARAVSWVVQKVPYSQTRWWTDSAGTFRQDCSGYVSMAWRTDQRINYWTGNLARISDRVASAALRPGDVLNLAGKHVVIFAGWEDSAKTKFRLFEQYATGHTPRFVRNAPLSYYLTRGYGAYRYDGIVENSTLAGAAIAPVGASAVSSSHRATVALMAASSDLPRAEAAATDAPVTSSSAESWLAALPATDWSPSVAEQYTADDPVADSLPAANTPPAADVGSSEELIAAQRAMDAAASNLPGAQQVQLSAEGTPSGAVVLAAGLGLLFLAVPLAAASRGHVWVPVIPHSGRRVGE